MKVHINWEGKRRFEGQGESGHSITMDAKPEVGGENKGARPMELLLLGLGGCTGIDILMILEKMRFTIEEFRMEIEGIRQEEYPQKFTTIEIKYILRGENLTPDKVERAIRLSEEKYCSASASLNAKILTTYELNGTLYQMED